MRQQVSVLILSLGLVFAGWAQQNDFTGEYLERLENSKTYLVSVAKMMPESNYDFKPTPEALSFAEQLLHIGYAMDWHSQSLLGERKSRDWNTDATYKVGNKSKKEIIALIEKTFDDTINFIKKFENDRYKETLDYFGLKRTKRQILLLLTDHISHHRGGLVVYLRLNGLVPPRYVLFQ